MSYEGRVVLRDWVLFRRVLRVGSSRACREIAISSEADLRTR